MMMGPKVLLVPSLVKIPTDLLADVYVFANGVKGGGPFGFQIDVFSSVPGEPGYTPLRSVILVTWNDGVTPRLLGSVEEIRAAADQGKLSLKRPVIDILKSVGLPPQYGVHCVKRGETLRGEAKKMIHVGVDLHKKFSQVAALMPKGELIERRLANDFNEVKAFFSQLPKPAKVAVETTGNWWWMADLLEQAGHEMVLAHAKQTKAIAAARLKNDRVDAVRLAMLLRADLLPTVWVPPDAYREAKEVVRQHAVLVRMRTQLKNRINSMMAKRNIKPRRGKRWFTNRGKNELTSLHLSPSAEKLRDDMLFLLKVLDEQIEHLDQWLNERWGKDPRVLRLMTIPGIGRFTAIALVVELGEIDRFGSAKHLASYLGLTPVVRASGEHLWTGKISKQGNRLLRWLLVCATAKAIRRPGPLRTWGRALLARKGKKVAYTAVARWLAGIIYHVWKEGIDYLEFLRRAGTSSPDFMVS